MIVDASLPRERMQSVPHPELAVHGEMLSLFIETAAERLSDLIGRTLTAACWQSRDVRAIKRTDYWGNFSARRNNVCGSLSRCV